MATLTEENTSKRIKTKSWDIHYHEAGQGQPLVLVHGGGPGASAWSNFQPNIAYLAEHFHVFAVDLPGWGKSQAVTYDIRDNSGALAEFIDALGLGKVAIVGNSMGGSSCIRLTYERPDLISHLITLGSSAGVPGIFDAAGGLTEGVKALEAAYFNPSVETMRKFIATMTYDSRHVTDEFIEERVQLTKSRMDHVEGWITGHGKPMVRIDQSKLPEINIPTLHVHGRDDRTVNVAAALHLSRLIPNSRALIVNRCGHWVQLEHADEFNRSVTSFIKGQ
ncbi:alpha/beta fold hydrolase [Comamonas sp. Y33R10-2]|uniref:alpha/beta fold hydrolase n=1 Tax=Comamonas sp. Y33R10-2 TaxID=2853257 RepID=UPI001C5C9222|nr:alpha/beta hydrolase [Comamonas sp. Y33R10-2]QXZ08203.1 alpha/beta fold hydrolase [Comamonas sp. Y33R10-2]